MRITAAPKYVRLAGEEAASTGVEGEDTAAPAATTLADDESDDEADREVRSHQLTLLLVCLSKNTRILHLPSHLLLPVLTSACLFGSSSTIQFAAVKLIYLVLESKQCIAVTPSPGLAALLHRV